ncbi:MAG: LysM peptidoglycan-binding domain-containing protein [Bacteroidales bacterium]|nr:LysM peptidoglycan-binding domain-containing protein [Bacteroidales bacterium]
MNSYPNRRYLLVFLGLFLLQIFLVAQESVSVERSNNKVILEGTVYYIHMVKPGETLYAISKAYHISQKEIAIENPGVISGLRVGQAIKIPVDPKPQEEIDTSELPEPGETGRYHTVMPGETLYGIARIYNLREKDIKQANRGVSETKLKPGQRLRIPEEVVVEEEHAYDEEGLLYHKVKRKETLYSIAGYYGVSIDEIRSVNPELGWGGPKNGQIIRIPAPQLSDQKQAGEDSGIEDEEAYAAGYDEIEEYRYDEFDDRHENIRRTYHIAFFIPFDFREMEPLDSLLKDVKTENRRNRIIERYIMEAKIPQSVNFMEFFQGTLLAIDAMRQSGMKLDVRYKDTRRSIDRTRSILRDDELEDFDLFIGPFHDYNLEVVSEFARQHRIPLVTPFHNDLELLKSNPYLFQLSPSLESEYREVAKLVASKHMYNIVYVRNEDSLNMEKHEYLKELIFDGFVDYHPSDPVRFKEVILDLRSADKIIHSLSPNMKNLVVVPTADEALASSVVTSLYFQLDKYDIEVIGSPYWTEFSSIELRYFHKLNLVFYNSFWVDYFDPDIEAFMAKYRYYFYNEPTITSRKGFNYGILGHDISLYFLNALRVYGRRFILSLDEYEPGLVQGPYTFDRMSGGGGYENSHISFYRFLPDMSIQEFEVPPLPEKNYFFRPMDDPMRRRYLNREFEID